jgi:hypothetical protein
VSPRSRLLVLLLLVVAVPATAHTFGFKLGGTSPVCLAIGEARYRIAAAGEQADVRVKVDPAAMAPDFRIMLARTADEADFVIVDDGETPPLCSGQHARAVAVDNAGAASDIVVGFGGPSAPADYRIFVRSRFIDAEAAVAMFAAEKAAARGPLGRTVASRSLTSAN